MKEQSNKSMNPTWEKRFALSQAGYLSRGNMEDNKYKEFLRSKVNNANRTSISCKK